MYQLKKNCYILAGSKDPLNSYVVLVSSKIASPLQTLRPRGFRLGCALGLRKRQQICRSSSGSSIGSCGIGCCGGGGSVGAAAAGCTLTVKAAGRGLVGAGGVLRLCRLGLHYTLVARASPSRLALCPRGSRYAIAACATPSRLGLCPRGLRYALAARARHSRLGLRQRRGWRRRQWKQGRRMLALATRATCSQAWASPSRLGFARFALAARATRSRLGFAQTQQPNSKAAAAKAASAALPPICRSGSGWWQQRWQLRWHRLWQRWWCVSVSSNGGGGGGGSSGGQWQQRRKWRRQ